MFGARHSLRDGPATIGPVEPAGVDGDVVVVVDVVDGTDVVVAGTVVVVGGGTVPLLAGGAEVVAPVVVVVGAALTGKWRRMTPECFRLPTFLATWMSLAVPNVLEPLAANVVEAEASIAIIDTSKQDVTPRVANLKMRCVVFTLKMLNEPMCMQNMLAVSSHR
jgi:hypothetical protein